MKLKFRVLINGDGICWTGFIFAEHLDNAIKSACKMAENMGGSFLDVIKVEIV